MRKVICGFVLFSGLAGASPLLIPANQLFLNLSLFDEMDVFLTSSDTAFDDTVPLELLGPDTDAWSSTYLSQSVAVATGPALTALTFLQLNLATTSGPVTMVVQVRYQGGEVRSVQLSYDGTQWTSTVLPPSGGQPLNLLTLITGGGGPNPGGSNPPGGGTNTPQVNAPTVVPEAATFGGVGLALVLLAGLGRRRRT